MTATPDEGVAVVVPPFRDSADLEPAVVDILSTLDGIGERHCVVVVQGSGADGTADALVRRYPGRVLVTRLWGDADLDVAVRTGMRAALSGTDHRRIFLAGGDGARTAAELPVVLAHAREERADVVVGYRRDRAGGPPRRVLAWCRAVARRVVLRAGGHDIDWVYKLIDRQALTRTRLTGHRAVVLSELLVVLRRGGARVLHRPVERAPGRRDRRWWAGLPATSRVPLGQVARSAVDRVRHPRDPVFAVVLAAAAATSVGAYLFFAARGMTLAYLDAVSHLAISRRVLAASTPGAAHLGGVWLPLQHLLAVPLSAVDEWYRSGFAGGAVSMCGYIATTGLLYLTGVELTGRRLAGTTAALAFGANPNALYLQTTAMGETVLYPFLVAATWLLLRWCRTDDYRLLAAAAVATLGATLTRYEGWVFFGAATLVVAHHSWRHAGSGQRWTRVRANLVLFCFLAGSGIAGWVAWNAAIFGDALYFQRSEYSEPALWISSAEENVGDWYDSARTYLHAMEHNLGWPVLLTGAAGMTCFAWRTRLRGPSTALLPLLVFLPFFVQTLHSGQRPLHVPEVDGDFYNVRFALVMLLPAAVFTGYLATVADRLRRGRGARLAPAALALAGAGLLTTTTPVTLAEPMAHRLSASERANSAAAAWLRDNYDHGRVLMQSFNNEIFSFESGVPSRQIVYEGSYRQWDAALADPVGQGIRWIHLREAPGAPNKVVQHLRDSPLLGTEYELLFSDAQHAIYRRADR